MELKDLRGCHYLSGVERISFSGITCLWEDTVIDGIRFKLDGITYEAIEDPDDGYRSCMDELRVSNAEMRFTFPAIKVFCHMDSNVNDELLIVRDFVNGKEVLRVGTDRTDDWYPCFVADWIPENMTCNGGKEY